MRMKRIMTIVLLIAALLLSGCAMRTVDQMYCLPKRSEDHKDLRAAVDQAMAGLEYCAPLSGENRQTLQSADLDGDGTSEYLLYAKGGSETPLKILIFDEVKGSYVHTTTIENNGSAFDQVEYVQMDESKGMEIVVGCQVSDVPLRSVSVYQYTNRQIERLHQTGYTKFMTVDLDGDSMTELFVLRPGPTETDRGVAELYNVVSNTVERANEVNMSVPADKLKRILFGKLNDGRPAVYTAGSVEDTALITDVFTVLDSKLVNVSLSNESGTSVKTLRSYYVYADDLDRDGFVELPSLIPMSPMVDAVTAERQNLIRWYGMNSDGSEVDKLFTYHNFADGWYVVLDRQWASRVTVRQHGNQFDFYIWSANGDVSQQVLSIYALTGPNRADEAVSDNRFVLVKNDSVIYAAQLHENAEIYNITQESITKGFRMIETKWNTGET